MMIDLDFMERPMYRGGPPDHDLDFWRADWDMWALRGHVDHPVQQSRVTRPWWWTAGSTWPRAEVVAECHARVDNSYYWLLSVPLRQRYQIAASNRPEWWGRS